MPEPTRSHEKGTLAEMFMRLAPTVREDIADGLGIGHGLPNRHPDAAYEILRRVRKKGLIVALRAAVKAEVNRGIDR